MKPTILLVDDEPMNLETLEALLSDEGYELLRAEDGVAACRLAREHKPDLVLLDLMMPGMDGFEVCRFIRADPLLREIPIIIVTALSDEASRLEGLRAGADDFITKPCRFEEMRTRVRNVISLNRFRAIASSRRRFELLFELAPAGIVLTDATGTVRQANGVADDLMGAAAPGAQVGRILAEGLAPAQAEPMRRAVAEVLERGRIEPREVAVGADGTRCARVLGAPLVEDGERGVVLVLDEVTAEVRAREALRELNVRLEAQVGERTRELVEANELLMSYASFISHDLRTPLTIIKGFLSLLREGVVKSPEQVAVTIGHTYEACLQMQQMVENILQLAREEHFGTVEDEPVSVEPGPIIERLWRHVSMAYPHVTAQFSLGALPAVGVSRMVLERIFFNLLGNALKFSSRVAAPRVEIGAVDGAEKPTLFVRDNGVGFDERDAAKLFREFSRLDSGEKTEGLGLGLSLVGRLVRGRGGRIWAERAGGGGAVFFVELPGPGRRGRPGAAGSAGGGERR